MGCADGRGDDLVAARGIEKCCGNDEGERKGGATTRAQGGGAGSRSWLDDMEKSISGFRADGYHSVCGESIDIGLHETLRRRQSNVALNHRE